MNYWFIFRRILLFCITLLLLLLAWAIFAGATRQFSLSQTIGQQVETFIQLFCGLLTLLTVITIFWWRKWASFIRASWVASLVLTAGLSALVWGAPMPLIALLFATVALLLSLTTIWALRRLTTDDKVSKKQSD